jgi:hypothetical protein
MVLLVGFPVAVVVPLLIASYFIGPASIWLWAGIGLGMLTFGVYKRAGL